MNIFDSKKYQLELEEIIAKANKKNAKLGIVQIGENSISEKYVNLKIDFCHRFGIEAKVLKYDLDLSDFDIKIKLQGNLENENFTGVIVQLPLPRRSLQDVLNILSRSVDIDVLNTENKYNSEYLSPSVRAFKSFYKESILLNYHVKKVAIIGFGELIGEPISLYMNSIDTQYDVILDYKEGNFLDYDLVVLGIGKQHFINPKDLRDRSCVVDFGSSVINGKIFGDLDTSKDISHLGLVSLSPGGVGPLVVRFLIMNLLRI